MGQNALDKTDVGQVVNIMSNDAGRFDQPVMFRAPYIIVAPLQALISTVILYFFIGPSCLIGIAILVLCAPFQSNSHFNFLSLFYFCLRFKKNRSLYESTVLKTSAGNCLMH